MKYCWNDKIGYFSDYDFLVIVEKTGLKHYEIENTIEDRGKSRKIPVNIELHEIDYVNEGLSFGQYFFNEIIQDGVLLYDTEKFSLVNPRKLSPDEELFIAKNYFDLWFPRGVGFLKVASYCQSEGDYKIGVFNLHQAAEAFYSTALLTYIGYKPKSHNLWKLRKRLKTISEDLFLIFDTETNEKDKYLFDLLKRGYIDARYKSEYNITKDELGALIKKVEKIQKVVQVICSTKFK